MTGRVNAHVGRGEAFCSVRAARADYAQWRYVHSGGRGHSARGTVRDIGARKLSPAPLGASFLPLAVPLAGDRFPSTS